MKLIDAYFCYGFVSIAIIIAGLIRMRKKKYEDLNLDIYNVKNSSKQIIKQQLSIFDLVVVSLIISWIVAGFFTNEGFLFALLLFTTFILPGLQTLVFKPDDAQLILTRSKKIDTISSLLDIVVTLYIMYHHFFVTNFNLN